VKKRLVMAWYGLVIAAWFAGLGLLVVRRIDCKHRDGFLVGWSKCVTNAVLVAE
jgi:hypothetical protein